MTLGEAEGAKIAVVREVKDGQTFPAYDFSGWPPPVMPETDNVP